MTTVLTINFNALDYNTLVKASNKTFGGEYLPTTFFTADGYMVSYDISACNQDPSSTGKTIIVSWEKDTQYGIEDFPSNNWGGNRPGSGRPSTGRKRYQFYVTDTEAEQIQKLIDSLRKPSE